MKMKKVGFSRWERFLNLIGLYNIYLKLIGKQVTKNVTPNDLLNYANTTHLIKYFDGHLGHGAITANGNLGFGLIHASFINSLQPERVLVIGSKQGYIPAICGLACKAIKKGKVDFVDAGYGAEDDNNWGGTSFWKDNDPDEHFSIWELNKYIDTYVMTSAQYAKKFPKRKYQYIYVDGDHSYEGVKKDYRLFWPKLASGGFMVFHDIKTKGTHHDVEFGVWKFWNELKDKNKIEFVDGVNALGIVQKN